MYAREVCSYAPAAPSDCVRTQRFGVRTTSMDWTGAVRNPAPDYAARACHGGGGAGEVQTPARRFRARGLALIQIFAAAIAAIRMLAGCAPVDQWSLPEGQHPQRY